MSSSRSGDFPDFQDRNVAFRSHPLYAPSEAESDGADAEDVAGLPEAATFQEKRHSF